MERMICRIKSIDTLEDYRLLISFDDCKTVIYDVNKDIDTLPGYHLLKQVPGLFQQVQLDESRTCVYWNSEIDLPSDAIYEYGTEIAKEPVS